MAKHRAHVDELEIDLTPMIDVVFQLIIFFMCIMKFKTLEKKIAAYLPKDVGLAKTQQEIPEKLKIQVTIHQKESQGVPRYFLMNTEIGGNIGVGVPPLVPPDDKAPSDEKMAYQKEYERHWAQYIKPKLDLLRSEVERYHRQDVEAPGELKAGPDVRHAFVIGALDCYLHAGMKEVTFVGTPDKVD